jgi:superfamily II DNA or RNA helicase
MPTAPMNENHDLQEKLDAALAEINRLQNENAALRKALALSNKPSQSSSIEDNHDSHNTALALSKVQKVVVFRSLFRGREDVYAVRWESSKGVTGYSPAHSHKNDGKPCRRSHKECERLGERLYFPLTDGVIYGHLTGRYVVGIYPLLQDDTCYFLAIDLDKQTWREDITEFLRICREVGVAAYPERSRSGSGAHVWIFFEKPAPARKSRSLGSLLLAAASNKRYQIGLDSYDRMFPNQDLLPKGGFGNLIALPLQKRAREKNNSVFLDESLQTVPDQWQYLSNVRKVSEAQLEAFLKELSRRKPEYIEPEDETAEPDFVLSQDSGARDLSAMARGRDNVGPTRTIRIRIDNMLFLETEGLPSSLIRSLISCASFSNPDFYRAQKLRLSVYGKPRVISCADVSKQNIKLPRGCLDSVREKLKENGIRAEVDDERFHGTSINIAFLGELREYQEKAFHAITDYDTGVLCASTAFGKTVVALKMIADRGVNTLILVHRKQIADHWREKILTFLAIDDKDVGMWTGGKKKPSGIVDIATLQSLARQGNALGVVENYGHVVVDECHHVPAFSFEQVMKRVRARYILGLTATPVRRDGHHPIIYMQCGPIRYKSTEKAEARLRPFEHIVIPKETSTNFEEGGTLGLQAVYDRLLRDEDRNELILEDICKVYAEGRSALVLSERKEHLAILQDLLSREGLRVFTLHGTLKKKQARETVESIRNLPEGNALIILATGRFLGEGFDEPRLDTLFLTLPISWKGTLQQYAGRLHRRYDSKKTVIIYDYVDSKVGVLQRMFKKRLTGYSSIGYRIQEEQADLTATRMAF